MGYMGEWSHLLEAAVVIAVVGCILGISALIIRRGRRSGQDQEETRALVRASVLGRGDARSSGVRMSAHHSLNTVGSPQYRMSEDFSVELESNASRDLGDGRAQANSIGDRNLDPMHKTYRVPQRVIGVVAGYQDKAFAQLGQHADELPTELAGWIKKSFVHMTVGIIVSDMSGFTRLTREYGVVHFASIIIRMRQVCLPIFQHYGAIHIATEADDFIVTFPTAAAAALAAFAMQTTILKYNNSLPRKKSHFSLTLNGVGIDYGRGPVVDCFGKLFGNTFVNAYALGEDLCEKGAVLVSGNVRQAVEASPHGGSAHFKKVSLESEQAQELAPKVGGLHEISFDHAEDFSVPGCDDDRFLSGELLWLTRRHSMSMSSSELSKLDAQIKSKFMEKRAILMVNFAYERADEPEVQLRLQFECATDVQNTLKKHNGVALENEMFAFRDAATAVKAALDIREQLTSRTKEIKQKGRPLLLISGYGIHMGDLLIVPDTDVHWGDPVNTASKLGQDLATNSDILISDAVYNSVRNNNDFKNVVFQPQRLEKSKVTFNCYRVVGTLTRNSGGAGKLSVFTSATSIATSGTKTSQSTLTSSGGMVKPTMSSLQAPVVAPKRSSKRASGIPKKVKAQNSPPKKGISEAERQEAALKIQKLARGRKAAPPRKPARSEAEPLLGEQGASNPSMELIGKAATEKPEMKEISEAARQEAALKIQKIARGKAARAVKGKGKGKATSVASIATASRNSVY